MQAAAVAANDIVTIIVHRSEIGQACASGSPRPLAKADRARVRGALAALAVGDEATYGGPNTDGSRSIRLFAPVHVTSRIRFGT